MSSFARVLAVVFGMVLVATVAFAQPAPGSLTLRAGAGFSNSRLDGWNEPLRGFEQQLTARYDPLGPSLRPSVELAWSPEPGITIGGAVTYQKLKSNETYAPIGFGSITEAIDLTLWRSTWRAAWWPAFAPSFYVGGEFGLGSAKVTERVGFIDLTEPANSFTSHQSWSGSHVVSGLFGGIERPLGKRNLLGYFEVGWAFQDFGQIGDARYDAQSPNPVQFTAPNSGKRVITDFSGLQVTAGLGWSVGGRR